jgi:acetylornithine/succinyldiaminopimelate/putrescine aminotransferase
MTASKIADLNHHLRRTFSGGKVMMTAAVAALEPFVLAEVLEKVRTFAEFNADNDPHLEHDFGVVTVEGERYFWKVDYYDLSMDFGSEDPSDPTVTTRVLTIGHVSDY